MLLKRGKYSGYILLESMVALALVTVILLQLIPLTVFVENKKQEHRDKLEVYRYFNELASSFYYHGRVEFVNKSSNGLEISAKGRYTEEQIKSLVLEMDGESFEICWLSEQNGT
ncbi:hypothetical protein [uncultured Vagococcus sp.]|uniref:hypothetical protein n=1 Tax=uncultured Vagococcus sp. TaxID=189676 RepID=UPI0028D803ED|nr:hypothetical protein [uncultured Vagococcus sp.]